MKPFNIEEAKVGKPVVTRTGLPVRIICWDRKDARNIVGLVQGEYGEQCCYYHEDGRAYTPGLDLFMAPVKREGWVVISRGCNGPQTHNSVFSSKEEADNITFFCGSRWLATVKIEWEE